MSITAPHYLLLCESKSKSSQTGQGGRWSFVLEQLGGSQRIEVAEDEPGVHGERLQLFAVVRGLEALEQPSCVTLVTSSAYVGRGIRVHLPTWRENGFQWERFGIMTPIKNQDLWMRVSRDMAYHQVECRIWNFNIRRRSADKKIMESENPLAANNVGSRWETGRGNSLIKDTANAALTKFSAAYFRQIQVYWVSAKLWMCGFLIA